VPFGKYKLSRMGWAGLVARMGEKRNMYRFLGKTPLGRVKQTAIRNVIVFCSLLYTACFGHQKGGFIFIIYIVLYCILTTSDSADPLRTVATLLYDCDILRLLLSQMDPLSQK
jgi:hypothetical protein